MGNMTSISCGKSYTTRFEVDADIISECLTDDVLHLHTISEHVNIHYVTHAELTQPELFVLRFGPQAKLDVAIASDAHTLMFLIAPSKPVGLDLRLAGHLAEVVQSDHFEKRWLAAGTEKDMNEVLMRDDHFLHVIAMIERDGDIIVATPEIELRATDEVAIIGEPVDLQDLRKNPGE